MSSFVFVFISICYNFSKKHIAKHLIWNTRKAAWKAVNIIQSELLLAVGIMPALRT
jgi:hypothetical protein